MKKIYFSLLLAVTALFSACDMDKTPYSGLDDTSAIQSANDLRQLRNNLYVSLRSVTSGSWLYYQDLQMDEFHGLVSNGNRGGTFSNGLFNSSDGYIEDFWQSCYSVIAVSNAAIEHAERLVAEESFSDEDKTEFAHYKGEAYFIRAYMYFWLADHFCQSYTQTTPSAAASGLPIQLVYSPSGDIATYPSRSTLDETYAQIESDLATAYTAIKAYETAGGSDASTMLAPNAAYISSYAVEALQARVALVKGDWTTALTKATDVINSGIYSLTTIEDYAKLWSDDEGTEVILRPFMSNTELGGSTGAEYISDSETSADYIPTFATLAGYGDGDVRFDAFFKVYKNLTVEGSTYAAYVCNKFPGNTTLRTSTTNNIVNMMKPFRLSEMYLIAAEASARQGNTSGSQYLNTFRKARIEGYEEATYNASSLLSETLTERRLEFLGEGMRFSDVRRLGNGFSRYASHDENSSLNSIIVAAGRSLSYAADDYRLTWPIPKTEMDSNPNLKGQQNPGY